MHSMLMLQPVSVFCVHCECWHVWFICCFSLLWRAVIDTSMYYTLCFSGVLLGCVCLCVCMILCMSICVTQLSAVVVRWYEVVGNEQSPLTPFSLKVIRCWLRFWEGGSDSWRTVHRWWSPLFCNPPPTPGVRDCGIGTSTPPSAPHKREANNVGE